MVVSSSPKGGFASWGFAAHAKAAACCAAILALGLTLSGCNTVGGPPFAGNSLIGASYASAGPVSGRGATIAFESIDGPPEAIFQKLVKTLSDEAESRQVAVVSREAAAHYRIRGYLSAERVHRKAPAITYVWDVYDAGQQRVLRILGEETASVGGRNVWDGANDAVLRRITKSSVDRLMAFFNSPDGAPGVEVAPNMAFSAGGQQSAALFAPDR